MIFPKQILLMFALYVSMHTAFAVSVFQCEDERGNVSFQDACPPGTKQLNQKNYKTSLPAATVSTKASLTLYFVPDCDTCDQVKEFLNIRNLKFTEKNVAADVKIQEELRAIAGELNIPTLAIGDKILSGYDRTALLQTLTESGHIATGSE